MKSLQPNPRLIRWQESLFQLDITFEYLESKKHIIADTLSRIYNLIKIPPTRDSTSSADNRHSSTEQLPFTTHHLTFPIRYLTIPLPIITSFTTSISYHNNTRINAGNSSRRYEGDDPEYRELLDINYTEDNRIRALTSCKIL